MEEKDPKHDDMPQQLDIREVLLDAGYRQNRRFGLRLPSYVRLDSEGKRIRGDKFVLTQDGKRCFRPPRKKEYDAVSFIKEHPQLFAEYYEGIDPDDLVEFVSDRLLPIPAGALRKQTVEPPDWEVRPFDITDYELHRFDPKKRATQKRFYTYFTYRGIDLRTQAAFHRSFCLATKKRDDGVRYTRLSFPMVLPKEAGKIVGFEERGRARADGSSSYEDYAQGSNMDEGVWIASPAGTPLAEAKHVYWFESAFDAMAYYQLHRDRNRELDKAVFVSTSNFPSTKQMRGVLEQTIPARQHICFNSSTAWHDSAWKLEREIYCTVRDAIEQTPERKPYLDSIPDGQDLTEGEYYLLPKGGLQESCKWFDSEWEEAMSMRSSRLCAPEDVQDQIDTMNRCYREYREKLREFLGIDREHDVDFTREEPDYRHKSWNGQLLAEQRREESVGQRQEREESAEEERHTLHPAVHQSSYAGQYQGQSVDQELPLILACIAALVYGGMEGMPLGGTARAVALSLLLALLYRFACLRRIRYRIDAEQLVCEHGLLRHKVDYMELYRIVDFEEYQNLLQQLCGLKTVRILSTDRNMPRLDLTGMRRGDDIVPLIRERVEQNKREKGIYEITNH